MNTFGRSCEVLYLWTYYFFQVSRPVSLSCPSETFLALWFHIKVWVFGFICLSWTNVMLVSCRIRGLVVSLSDRVGSVIGSERNSSYLETSVHAHALIHARFCPITSQSWIRYLRNYFLILHEVTDKTGFWWFCENDVISMSHYVGIM